MLDEFIIKRVVSLSIFFFFKQKSAYEMRISDWSSDVCSSDLCDPGEEVGEPSIAVAIFCEVHHRRRSSDRQVTGNAQMLAHDVDELRIALGRPDGGEMADGPEAEAD